MSLYEPSVRSSTWSMASRSARRPLTTLEGWKELGAGVFTMKASVRTLSLRSTIGSTWRSDRTGESTLESVPAVPAVPTAFLNGKPPTYAPRIAAADENFDEKQQRTELWEVQYPQPRTQEPVMVETIAPQDDDLYSSKAKWTIMSLITLAGMFPNLSFFMFLPALDNVSRTLGFSTAVIDVTITFYLLFQAVGALIWRPISESVGRRPIYLGILSTYVVATILLAFPRTYPTLFIFRGLQALAITGTTSVGIAVMHDIYVPSEAAHFQVVFQYCQFVALALAPTLGGLLADSVGWRLIFVTLLSLSAALLIAVVLFLPETQKIFADDGPRILRVLRQPLAYQLGISEAPIVPVRSSFIHDPSPITMRSIIAPLKLLREKDIMTSLLFGGIVFMIWMMVTVSTTSLFVEMFHLSDLQIGVSYISNTLGVIGGSIMMKSILQSGFKMSRSDYRASHSLPKSMKLNLKSLPADFPLEHSRLRHCLWIAPILVISLCGYGFTIFFPSVCDRPGWILFPLFLQFLIAFMAHAICTIMQTLVMDLWHQSEPDCLAAIVSVQSIFSAFGVGIIQPMLDGTGTWCVFVILGIALMLFMSLPAAHWYWGSDWRAEREARMELVERFASI